MSHYQSVTKAYKAHILALVDLAKKIKAQRDGETWSDTRLSVSAFGHGDFILRLRPWMGGTKGPTLEKMRLLEEHLREIVGEDEYKAFLERITAPVDDF